MSGQHTIAQTERKLSPVARPGGGSNFNAEAMELGGELFRAFSAYRNRLEQGPLAAHDLSWSAFQVLWVVWAWQPVETREVAAEVGLGKPSLSGVLATLDKRALITRKKSRDDARLVLVALTQTGQDLIAELLPKVASVEAAIAELVHESNRPLLVDLLRTLAATNKID